MTIVCIVQDEDEHDRESDDDTCDGDWCRSLSVVDIAGVLVATGRTYPAGVRPITWCTGRGVHLAVTGRVLRACLDDGHFLTDV